MKDIEFYEELVNRFRTVAAENNLLDDEITITSRALSTKEAIGNPERRDYPIIKGKEKLMQAEFKGFKGQAFTDMPGMFQGSLKQVLEMVPENNCDRAILVASMNAVLRYLNLIDRTIHCHDEEPEECAQALLQHIQENYPQARIGLIGLQPAILEKLSRAFTVRVVDIDEDNIGQMKSGVEVEGFEHTDEVLEWCDLIVATGSTVVNATINRYVGAKPAIFFGTTGAGAAHLMNLERWCYKGA
ncbi:MAG: DUF364 domain-containing protein [Bacillota bacterium]|nr:DUF364 domain-containing protein [Bacillota bacterium]